MTKDITPNLWFDGNAKEAVIFMFQYSLTVRSSRPHIIPTQKKKA
jgi:predicted 3-demethylubiquinone-9 3-methyltransferase (glyoxalase superfamily)